MLKSEATPAYWSDGWGIHTGLRDKEPIHKRPLYHSAIDDVVRTLSPNDLQCANAAPLLKATILEQRERIAELEDLLAAEQLWASSQYDQIYHLNEQLTNIRRVNNDT